MSKITSHTVPLDELIFFENEGEYLKAWHGMDCPDSTQPYFKNYGKEFSFKSKPKPKIILHKHGSFLKARGRGAKGTQNPQALDSPASVQSS